MTHRTYIYVYVINIYMFSDMYVMYFIYNVHVRSGQIFLFWKDLQESKSSGTRRVRNSFLFYIRSRCVSCRFPGLIRSYIANPFSLFFKIYYWQLRKCRGCCCSWKKHKGGSVERLRKSKLSSSLFLLRRYFSSPLTSFNALLHPVKRTYCVCGYM